MLLKTNVLAEHNEVHDFMYFVAVFLFFFLESTETLPSHTPYRLVNNFQPSFTEAVVRKEGLEFCAFLFPIIPDQYQGMVHCNHTGQRNLTSEVKYAHVLPVLPKP